jgi:methylenetetrahydrofolate reductase (NADPH)
LDWSRTGRETWGTVASEARSRGLLSPAYLWHRDDWREKIENCFRDIRQPEWWQGDDQYHPPLSNEPISDLHAALVRGEFVVTAEVAPPTSADAEKIRDKADRLRNMIHAANVTQNSMATARMSSLASCALLLENGVEPILQLTARDYNRFALQSETLGASVLGIRNILCLTGDPPTNSRGPAAGLPFDLDATQMLWILRRMRDEAQFLDARAIEKPPCIFLGTAASPCESMPQHEARRLEKKINAGAQFIQTQLVYDIELIERWLEALEARNPLTKAHFLVGIGPLRSVRVARYMLENIPDIAMPVQVIERMERSPDPKETGLEIALELIDQIRHLPGASGIHLMSVGWESILPRLLREAGLITTPVGPDLSQPWLGGGR